MDSTDRVTDGDRPAKELVANIFVQACPSRRTVEHVGSKWGSLTLIALLAETYRFNMLRRRVEGISEKMLAQTLHTLERDGLVTRTVHAQFPPHVEYGLTEAGTRITVKLKELVDVVEAEMPTVESAQARFDRSRKGGKAS